MTGKVRDAQKYFEQCVKDWHKADKECQRTFAMWSDACKRRLRLASAKNNALGELEMHKAAATMKKRQ